MNEEKSWGVHGLKGCTHPAMPVKTHAMTHQSGHGSQQPSRPPSTNRIKLHNSPIAQLTYMTTDTKPSTSPPAPAAPASAPAARLDPLPTEMRLRALEARVRGIPATTLEETPRPPEEDGVTLTHRVASLRGKLDQVAETSPPIKQFLENCECTCSWSTRRAPLRTSR